jgi:hypothetical protein
VNALRRVAAAPWLVLALWGSHVVIAIAFGSVLSNVVAAAVMPFAGRDDGYVLGAVVEVLSLHPSIAATMMAGLVLSAIVGAVGWMLVAGLVIARLTNHPGADTSPSGLGATWLATLPGVVVTSLWHFLIRAAVFVIVAISVAPLPRGIALVVFAIALAVSTLALDIARVQVVLHAARPFHVRTAADAYAHVVRHWRLVIRALGPWLLQMLVVATSLWLALASLGGGSHLWMVRGLSLVGVVLGLWRVALIIDAVPQHHDSTDDDTGSAQA